MGKVTFEELAQREQDGILVRLWWLAYGDTITVTVVDTKEDKTYTLYPQPHQALDCYYHPFAYIKEDE
jgi:hypothetical protein